MWRPDPSGRFAGDCPVPDIKFTLTRIGIDRAEFTSGRCEFNFDVKEKYTPSIPSIRHVEGRVLKRKSSVGMLPRAWTDDRFDTDKFSIVKVVCATKYKVRVWETTGQ